METSNADAEMAAGPSVERHGMGDHDRWYFGGRRRFFDGVGSVVISRSDLAVSSVADLRRAMRSAQRHDMGVESIQVAANSYEEFDEEYVPVEPVSFELLSDGRIALRVFFPLADDVDPYEAIEKLPAALGPFLKRSRASLVVEDEYAFFELPSLLILVPARGKYMRDLFLVGEGISLLGTAYLDKQPGRRTLRDLVLSGHANLLLGYRENEWFDAKADHYLYGRGEEGKVKLARAIAQFCNGDDGGIVVVGLKTGKTSGNVSDHVVKLTPVPITGATVRQYRDAIEKHLFPFPVGLTVDAVEAEEGSGSGYVVVSLPPQPEELKPYLVHGAIVAGKTEGSFFTIIRRSGEDGLPLHASQIHNMLVTGRALLRHGLVPGKDPEN